MVAENRKIGKEDYPLPLFFWKGTGGDHKHVVQYHMHYEEVNASGDDTIEPQKDPTYELDGHCGADGRSSYRY
jgi:hypothetical protein